MELLGERPVWSMSGGEMLSTLDALDVELARLQTYRLHVIAGIEDIGYANEIGAHDTARLLTFRHRIDSSEAHRDVRLARALPKYDAVAAALPDTTPPAVTQSDVAVSPTADPNLAADDAVAHETADRRPLRPAQARAIVWALDRVAARVTADNLAVAEEQLVGLAAHLSPAELRKAGKQIGDLLDSDGPEPDEHKAYARESLTLANSENGVNFRGFLANENAELFRSLIHAGARPHRTIDGEPDPRSREKRQADALSTTLTLAATATDTGPLLPTPNTTPDATATPTLGATPTTTGPTAGTTTAPAPGTPSTVPTSAGAPITTAPTTRTAAASATSTSTDAATTGVTTTGPATEGAAAGVTSTGATDTGATTAGPATMAPATKGDGAGASPPDRPPPATPTRL